SAAPPAVRSRPSWRRRSTSGSSSRCARAGARTRGCSTRWDWGSPPVKLATVGGKTLPGLPVAEALPNQHQLTDVVGVVIGHQEQLAQVCLSLAVGDAREEVDGGVFGQLLQGVAVAAERGQAFRPGPRRRRGRLPGPVVVG